jgi:hypothetical protein
VRTTRPRSPGCSPLDVTQKFRPPASARIVDACDGPAAELASVEAHGEPENVYFLLAGVGPDMPKRWTRNAH